MPKQLAVFIADAIRDEFETVHFSGNLAATIKVYQNNGNWCVEIPAEVYDVVYYMKNKRVVHTEDKSYASEVDKTGGFSGKHKDYVDRCIKKAIYKWLNLRNATGRIID